MTTRANPNIDDEMKAALAEATALVVDDHDPIRKAIRRVLDTAGFGKVVETFDVASAKKSLKEHAPSLVVCDLNLGSGSGFEVVESIRHSDLGADVPILIVTGEGGRDDIVKAVDLGANDYLVKPFQAEDLEKKVLSLVRSFILPDKVLKLIRMAESLLMQNKYQMALVCADEALTNDTKNVRARFLRAFAMRKLGRIQEARAALEELIRENGSNFRALGLMADIKLSEGRKQDAIDLMTRELSFNGKQPDRQVLLGQLLLDQGLFVEAIEHLRLALLQSQRHREALITMGHAQARSGNIDKALYYFSRMRRYYPDARDALEAVVATCEQIQDLRRAEIILRDERKAHPGQNDAAELLARVYFMQEKLDDAITVAGELAANGESAEAAMIQAMALSKSGKDAEALAALESIKRGGDQTQLQRLMATLHLKLNRPEKAEPCALKSFAAQPWSSAALVLQGEALLKTGCPLKTWFALSRARQMGCAQAYASDLLKEASAEARKRRKPSAGKAGPTRVAS